MSQLNITTLGNQAGTSTVPSETVIAGSAKAWVNFNGSGTVAIRDSFNTSSITDNGTGDYTVNFTSAMADTNYACLVSQSRSGGANPPTPISTENIGSTSTKTTTACRVGTGGNTGAYDSSQVSVAIFSS